MSQRLSLIAAVARNGIIGRDNDLPWRLSADLQYFKKITTGHAIVLGRKNYESIGKPLPNRTNIIITRDENFTAEGCLIAHTLDDAIAQAGNDDEIFIIGGAQIYALAMEKIDRMYLTEVKVDVEGDVIFPAFDRSQWQEISREAHIADDKNEYNFDFVVLERKT